VIVLELELRLLEGFGTTSDSILGLLAEYDYTVAPLAGC
jgi:hypothetical protein